MHTAIERPEFTPPPQPGVVGGIALALLAHALLLLALTWGVRWNREDRALAVEAELWSATPQQAAPRPVEPPPQPRQPEPPAPTPAPAPPAPREADIAVQREKQRQLAEKKRAEEQERQRELAEEKKRADQEKLADEKKRIEQQKLADEKKLAAQKKQEEQARAAKRQEQEVKLREEIRREQIRRAQGLAGATGDPSSEGTAARASGPSGSYAGRIRAKVQPNIVFGDMVSGNPEAEVEVRMAPDGTITSTRVVKSSGVRTWDDAVVRALDRTAVLPRDVDGRVHSPVIITFRPKG